MKTLKSVVSKIFYFSGIDFHVGFTLLFRLWSILIGSVLLVFIPLYLTSPEQGYYFTFSSLIAAQIFFELGFNFVVTQVVSHEMPNMKYNKDSILIGNKTNVTRVFSLIKLIRKWYFLISILFFLIILTAGYIFFCENGHLPLFDWLPVWVLLVFFSSINLYISPFLAILEGVGFVGQVAKVRLFQSVIGYGLLLISLKIGLGLYAVVTVSCTSAICSLLWMIKRHRKLLLQKITFSNDDHVISWRREIFPFQWKIALSWLSGYFIFQLFNPLIFAYQGAVEAGRIGLTLTVFSTIVSLSMSWITAKSPVLAKLIAEQKVVESKKLFKTILIKSGCCNVVMMGCFIAILLILRGNDFALAMRVADNNILYMLFFSSIANHLIFAMATYMRTFKKEPMIWNSLGTGLLIAITLVFSARISSAIAIASYSTIIIAICLPWTIYIYNGFIKTKTAADIDKN